MINPPTENMYPFLLRPKAVDKISIPAIDLPCLLGPDIKSSDLRYAFYKIILDRGLLLEEMGKKNDSMEEQNK